VVKDGYGWEQIVKKLREAEILLAHRSGS